MERKGICKNVGVCTLAGKVQIITDDDAEMVCPECGEPLEPYKEEPLPEGPNPKKKLLMLIVAFLLLIGFGVGAYFLFAGSDKPKAISLDKEQITMKVGETIVLTPKVEPEGVKATFIFRPKKGDKIVSVSQDGKIVALKSGETKVLVKCAENPKLNAACKISISNADEPVKIDSTTQNKDSVVTQPVEKKEQKVEPKKTESKPQQVTTLPKTQDGYGTVKLGYGVYEGPTENGKPSGMGGQIRFTRSYTIDLKKVSGETVEVNPGDVMVNVKMKDGRLIQGQLKRTDGSQRWIIIG